MGGGRTDAGGDGTGVEGPGLGFGVDSGSGFGTTGSFAGAGVGWLTSTQSSGIVGGSRRNESSTGSSDFDATTGLGVAATTMDTDSC